MTRKLINPGATQKLYDRSHFSQAIKVGDTVWVSGQVGIDEGFKPAADIERQVRLAFQNLKTVLESAGATLGDVVELTTFHIRMRADREVFGRVKDEFFADHYPCWTAVGITELALPELLVEIRAVAVIGTALK